MSKRIKSFLISLASVAGAALLITVLTPEFAGFTADIAVYLKSIGIPASLVAVLGIFISEMWRSWLNKKQIERASELGGHAASTVRNFDLY